MELMYVYLYDSKLKDELSEKVNKTKGIISHLGFCKDS